ncbi:hypothetical protein ETB97_010585 [Aspergillus alliaceus]|uniref:Uncharacterized protein n=1 Tax=Petromyces alliaceus TaxID=209559 RepID=A0A5N6FFI8_PETAA|nr:uncharacterized protein BDW43DRAFT_290228 [Aspergillus alliaceus]KAB8228712.1 hypothetical protein BDW43DRAFT_290228 [Aspergillus alliaceus]KAF5863126.1 hypothetical protein ETB97_010585 [Aspergillus burnettii]
MKLLSALFFGCLSLVFANPIVVTYPKDTPSSVLEDAMNSVISAGGRITHKYQLINGFSADAPESAVQQISVQSAKYNPTIEKDLPVSIQ